MLEMAPFKYPLKQNEAARRLFPFPLTFPSKIDKFT